jgi:dehydrogenase/reductase SDR family protein 12
MFSAFGQFAATSQFYLYGRTYFTRTGWEKASKHYKATSNGVDILDDPSLSLQGKVYMITGANSGIGREVTRYLACKGARVFMVCRNAGRGEEARARIINQSKNDKVHLIVADCSLESGVRYAWEEFLRLQAEAQGEGEGEGLGEGEGQSDSSPSVSRLDALICNAGVLHNEKVVTSEGVESTFATHLLFGVYLLGKLALPLLQQTPCSRVVVVSSGGLYNVKFPTWEKATSTAKYTEQYDGQLG